MSKKNSKILYTSRQSEIQIYHQISQNVYYFRQHSCGFVCPQIPLVYPLDKTSLNLNDNMLLTWCFKMLLQNLNVLFVGAMKTKPEMKSS